MAKGLPYFKFIVTEWLTGDIVYESFEVQGLFINICSVYWQRDGKLTVDDIEKRYNKPNALDSLLGRFISVSDGFISISFLDEQLVERHHVSKVNSTNGSLGGRGNKANAKRTLSEIKPIRRRIRSKEEEEKEYIDPLFLTSFEKWMQYKIDRKEKYKSKTSEKAFYDLLVKLSNNNHVIAEKIIDQSMANNWAGIFELKEKQITPNGNKASNGMVY